MKREKILELVKVYYAERFAQKDFEPGKTLIPFAGRRYLIFEEPRMCFYISNISKSYFRF